MSSYINTPVHLSNQMKDRLNKAIMSGSATKIAVRLDLQSNTSLPLTNQQLRQINSGTKKGQKLKTISISMTQLSSMSIQRPSGGMLSTVMEQSDYSPPVQATTDLSTTGDVIEYEPVDTDYTPPVQYGTSGPKHNKVSSTIAVGTNAPIPENLIMDEVKSTKKSKQPRSNSHKGGGWLKEAVLSQMTSKEGGRPMTQMELYTMKR